MQEQIQPSPRHISSKKRTMWIAVAGVAILTVITGTVVWNMNRQTLSAGPEATMSITETGIVPATITIKRGQPVTIVNNHATSTTDSGTHSIASDAATTPGLETSEELKPADTFAYTFDNKGVFKFYDPANPSLYTGTVIVE